VNRRGPLEMRMDLLANIAGHRKLTKTRAIFLSNMSIATGNRELQPLLDQDLVVAEPIMTRGRRRVYKTLLSATAKGIGVARHYRQVRRAFGEGL